MASPTLLPSSTSANSDLTRQSSTHSATNRDRSSNKFGNTMSMDELITDIYGDDPPPPPPDRDFDDRKMREGTLNEITLEEFLFRMGVVGVIEEDVKVPEMLGVGHRLPPQPGEGSSSDSSFWMGNGGRGRGKRRAVYTDPSDKVAQQRQRRMIKNRESAARSRERKQAYTMELESLVTQLEEENSLLQRERTLLNWERYKQLMKNLIPVEEKEKPRSGHVLRRAHSAHW